MEHIQPRQLIVNDISSDTIQIVSGSYDYIVVVMSVAIAILASYVALNFANHMAHEGGQRRKLWMLLGAATMGVGIWSMHFLGMLAYKLPFVIRYDPAITLLSIVPSGIASGLAFFVVGRQRVSQIALAGAALLMGMAISGMHYIGMAAMQMPAAMSYDPSLIVLSVLIGIAASWAALKLTLMYHKLHYPPEWQKQISAILMGVAISGMHYSGMAAMQIYEVGITEMSYAEGLDLEDYDGLFALLTLVFLIIMVVQTVRDRFSNERLSLAAKTTLMTSVLVIFAAVSVGTLSYVFIRDLTISEEVEQIQQEVAEEVEMLGHSIDRLISDILYLQQHPQLTLVLENLEKGAGAIEVSTLQRPRFKQLATIFQEILYARPEYEQIRLIGIRDGGRELVRLQRQEGMIKRTPEEALQRKGEETYFKEILSILPDEVYLSEITLNREHGVISLPHTLMLRAAKPVFDISGDLQGFLIINFNLNSVFKKMIATKSPRDADHISNQWGDVLMARDTKLGSVRQNGYDSLLFEVYPELKSMFTEERIVPQFHNASGQFVVNLQKLFYDKNNPQRFIAVSEVIPKTEIEHRVQPVLNRLFLMTLLLTVFTAWPVASLVRMIVRPLNRITEATAQFASGGEMPALDIDRGDEIGTLSRSFHNMVEQVNARERALTESEELTRKVIQNAGDGIVIINAKGEICSVNNTAIVMFGYSKEEMEGRNVSILMPEPYCLELVTHIHNYLESGCSTAIGSLRETEGRRKNGECFPLELMITEVNHIGGTIFVGMLRDVSKRKETEQELRLAGQVMEVAQESIVITEDDLSICAVNPAFTEITGYLPEEVIGCSPKILASGLHDQVFYERMWYEINTTGNWQGEVWDKRKNGEVYPKWLSISEIRDSSDMVTHYVSVASDITDRKLSEKRLKQLAHYDNLTGLPNRMLLLDRMRQEIEQSKRNNLKLALLFLDLDRFKSVNDNYGHNVGDQLLVSVAERFRGCIRETDTLARHGGDEFAILVSDVKESDDVARIAEHLIASLQSSFDLDGKECFVGVSIGIALFPNDGGEPDELMQKADTAMYRAKASGGKNYSLYDQRLGQESRRRLQMENALHFALKRNELELNYQPVISMESGQVVAVESLMRWHNDDLGSVSPAEFIPLAEDAGIIASIGRWGLEQACMQFCKWRDQGIHLERIAVNISPRCLMKPDLPDYIASLLQKYDIPPNSLELELTETAVMQFSETESVFFKYIEELGVRLAIDDFGTGYSSLANIKKLPIHVLKIDRSFVRDIERDPGDQEIIKGVVALAHGLGLEVVAEGVEVIEQLDFLRSLECDYLQGWYYLPAVSGEEISRLLANEMTLSPTN